ncbi:DeoR/GlpR family DNA-binding transcription regulator [Arthrobacter rhombi]|uniref:Glycerol-3-phosphate regulon repressor, DeoR family n=1 Tax=Arthrobacter rhombi TaxID=71253 RepID=A0A1R4FTK1_9MICC|nr:DeoR/GlpR family DNA-binding transcription regulator [Arthrobacter rhombi]SJM59330.1 Glycerol-3-phosphate regulon repressor, DeoR family [Arthrobacter rhombi]
MTRNERLSSILALLAEDGQVEVDEIVDKLGVSPATARRDLDSLDSQRLLTRTHGGATTNALAYDLPGKYNRDPAATRKRWIGAYAAALVEPDMSIGLSGGTTSSAIATALGLRADLQQEPARPTLTVVTNAVNIASALAVRNHVKVMVTGGVLNPRSYELVGPFAEQTLGRVTLDIAFIGVGGLHPQAGATVADEGEAAVNELMGARALRSYLVVDSSKLGVRSFASVSGDDLRHVITDPGITTEQQNRLEESGYSILIAPET